MHAASRAIAAGADFGLLGPRGIDARVDQAGHRRLRRAHRCGKSQTTRAVAALLAERGLTPVVVRHPMPYGDLVAQRVQRFGDREDLDRHDCTIEEREEYEPHIDAGRVVFAGVDYEAILREAEKEADVILWDGGNNDLPFFQPDLHIVVADPLRPGHERALLPRRDRTCAWPTWSSSTRSTRPPRRTCAAVTASIAELNPDAEIAHGPLAT